MEGLEVGSVEEVEAHRKSATRAKPNRPTQITTSFAEPTFTDARTIAINQRNQTSSAHTPFSLSHASFFLLTFLSLLFLILIKYFLFTVLLWIKYFTITVSNFFISYFILKFINLFFTLIDK